MRSKILFNLFAVALLVALSAVAASAQVITASGRVTIKQADGTTVPVKDAIIKFYRTDIKAEYAAKTDKNGQYVNVGIPLIGTYTITASAPGARPDYYPNIKISQHPENNFTLEPGDGNALTLDQIKAANNGAVAGGSTAANTAEAKKKEDAAAAERARVAAENQKAKDIKDKLPAILKAGTDAYQAKNYDEAIRQYDQGIQLDPEQNVFYAFKAAALRGRGVSKYNAAVRAKDQAGKDAAREDFKAAVENSEKAVAAYRANASKKSMGPAPGAAPGQQGASEEVGYLADRIESYRIALQTSTPVDNEAAVKAFQEYIAAETDSTKKMKAQASLGDALFAGGHTDEAIDAYKKVLATNPD